MTDKVQKIREEVEKIAKSINLFAPDEDGKNSSYEEGRLVVASQILQIIDSLQEEPVSIDFEKELYKAFGQIKDFTLGMRIAKWFWNMGKNSQEPVSEELEEASVNYAATGEFLPNGKEMIDFQLEKAFKAGANWQKKQFEKDCTDLCNGIATAKGLAVTMAYDKGMVDAREQMMANATEVTVHIDAGGYPYTPEIELYDYDKDVPLAKEGDKYKVVLIKED